MRTFGLLSGAALALLVSTASAQNADDHPLVTSYPGSVLEEKAVEDFATYSVVTGLMGQDFLSTEVSGTLTRLRYSSPPDRSEAEIFANYVQALEAAGFRELWRCVDDGCGPAFASARWNRFNGTINLGNNAHYAAGSLQTAGGEAYVIVAVAPRQHQVTIVEVSAMEEGLVSVDPDALGDELDLYGHVAIPGVYFETGKAELTAESAAALAAMAQILHERPELSVWVVGHTDWTGTFELNMSLSDARADAVVRALADRFGIDARRLEGYGVGPLSPDASNGTDSGRTANRRVELVARPGG
jgi:outer membrane protein OmpA-like peptidoglycan-associated protein